MSRARQLPMPMTDDDAFSDWNFEDSAELEHKTETRQAANLVVFSRDWTVDTVVSQIVAGNIDLDPEFQRRNAWKDSRRSRLLESFVLNFPVPQIVLAENPRKKKSFVVIDGKQRLLTIAALYQDEYRDYWETPRFTGLEVRTDLNRVSLDDFLKGSKYQDERRQISNADIRATIISNFKDESVLYDIFYRLNTGSVPLSSQELRQVLNKGPFAKFLMKATGEENPIWGVLNTSKPDPRLRDVELLLRLISWNRFSKTYVGNMKPFLDSTMETLNSSWGEVHSEIETLTKDIFKAVAALVTILGESAGRKYKNGRYESQINRALFEVEAFYLQGPPIRKLALKKKKALAEGIEELCETDLDFLNSIESTTKSIENYRIRFSRYRAMAEKVLGHSLRPLALSARS